MAAIALARAEVMSGSFFVMAGYGRRALKDGLTGALSVATDEPSQHAAGPKAGMKRE
jgi:hypothetical protein